MTYQVLARKYRPQDFSSVVGQEPIVTALRNAVTEARIAQAYLFSGIRGVGKTSVARILAKAVNCENGPAADPCNECAACTEITSGSDIDFIEVDAATHSKVEQVRELAESLKYGAARNRYKVVVVDEIHRLSRQAFDALLKIVEEPPPHLVFIFATTEIDAVPATILSRCQEFRFRRVPSAELAEHLRTIAAAESIEATDTALRLVARAGDGSVRDAVALLDQLATFGSGSVPEEEAARILGGVDHAVCHELLRAILEGDSGGVTAVVQGVEEEGWDPRHVFVQFLGYARDALHLALGAAGVELPEEEAARLAKLAKKCGYENLLRVLNQLLSSEMAVRQSETGVLAVEVAWLRATELPKLVAIEELLAGGGGASRKSDGSTSGPPKGSKASGSAKGSARAEASRPAKKPAARSAAAKSPTAAPTVDPGRGAATGKSVVPSAPAPNAEPAAATAGPEPAGPRPTRQAGPAAATGPVSGGHAAAAETATATKTAAAPKTPTSPATSSSEATTAVATAERGDAPTEAATAVDEKPTATTTTPDEAPAAAPSRKPAAAAQRATPAEAPMPPDEAPLPEPPDAPAASTGRGRPAAEPATRAPSKPETKSAASPGRPPAGSSPASRRSKRGAEREEPGVATSGTAEGGTVETFFEELSRRKQPLAAQLSEAHKVCFAEGRLEIHAAPDDPWLNLHYLQRDTNQRAIEAALEAVWGPGTRWKLAESHTPPPKKAAPPPPPAVEEVIDDPRVQTVLDIFGGTVESVTENESPGDDKK